MTIAAAIYFGVVTLALGLVSFLAGYQYGRKDKER